MNMFLGALDLKIFDSILGFLIELGKILTTMDYIVFGAVGLLFLSIFICLIVSNNTYEVKILRYLNKMNKYFKRNPHINDDNLIYVNNCFKKAPKNMRYAWQQYMLNRDKLPSEYINTEVCIDQPIKSSAHDNTSKILHMLTTIISILAFVAGLVFVRFREDPTSKAGFDAQSYMGSSYGWILVFVLPLLTYILGTVVVIILKARHTAIVSDAYNAFHDFERYINKACSTLPSYIDYEVLFTRKEIRDGIPALQEYLEKRAMEEQKEKEEAELKNLPFEEYNFEELGLENSLLIERAMTESEKFFNVKRDMNEKIAAKQTEMASYQKNFDEVTKEFERKAQAYRENLKQLNEQLNSTSVNIEANYIKKRYREDQQKLQQLEKDYEIATIRFNKQQAEINAENDAYKKEIERKKQDLQRAMTEEGKSYANKIYGIINTKLTEQNKPIFDKQNEQIAEMKKQIEDLDNEIKEKEANISSLNGKVSDLEFDITTKQAEIEAIKNVREYLTSPEFRQRVIDGKKARKASGIEKASIEELRDRTATAEEELKIANEKQQKMAEQESELLRKLKQLEETERLLLKEKAMNDDLKKVNSNIKAENESLKANEADLMGEINKTLENLDEDNKQQKVDTKKKNLSSLQANMSKLKNKKKPN